MGNKKMPSENRKAFFYKLNTAKIKVLRRA